MKPKRFDKERLVGPGRRRVISHNLGITEWRLGLLFQFVLSLAQATLV